MKNKVSLYLVVVLSLALTACSSKTKKTDFFGEDEKGSCWLERIKADY